MGEVGILNPDEKVELLAGQIVKKQEKGTRHTSTNKRLEKYLENTLVDRVLVRTQDPIRLDDFSSGISCFQSACIRSTSTFLAIEIVIRHKS